MWLSPHWLLQRSTHPSRFPERWQIISHIYTTEKSNGDMLKDTKRFIKTASGIESIGIISRLNGLDS